MRKKDKFDVPIKNDQELATSLAYMDWADHGILRKVWTNFYQIGPGVYRSNHPSVKQFHRFKDMGIKTVLSFRAHNFAPTHTERYICDKVGLTLAICPLSATRAPRVDEMNALLEMFDTLEKPFVMHCKSGADRSSIASALYQIDQMGYSPVQAKAMMSIKFIHLKWTKKGILDTFLKAYSDAFEATGIGLRDWIRTDYDPDALQSRFIKK